MMQTKELNVECFSIIKELIEYKKAEIDFCLPLELDCSGNGMSITKSIQNNSVFNSETYTVELFERLAWKTTRQLALVVISFEENIERSSTYNEVSTVLRVLNLFKDKHITLSEKLKEVVKKYSGVPNFVTVKPYKDSEVSLTFSENASCVHVKLVTDTQSIFSPYIDSRYMVATQSWSFLKQRGGLPNLIECLDLFL